MTPEWVPEADAVRRATEQVTPPPNYPGSDLPPLSDDDKEVVERAALTDSDLFHQVRPRMFTAEQLQTRTFPRLTTYIDDLVIEGLTVLGGKPKLGKSFFALNGALAISTGGVAFGNKDRAVTEAPVLYLALEDGQARLQSRIKMVIGPDEKWPGNLMLVTEWPRLENGGIELMNKMISTYEYQVVIIDTLGRVRVPRRGRDSYQEDTDALSGLHDLTREHNGLALLAIHHNRKDDAPDDYIDALSGTTGITGVADHIAVLQRGRGDADGVLRFTSRDAAEHDTAFAFNDGAWTELGSAAEHNLSKARKEVYEALVVLGEAGVTDISEYIGKDKGQTLRMLRGLEVDGLAHQDGPRGSWRPGPHSQQSQQQPRS